LFTPESTAIMPDVLRITPVGLPSQERTVLGVAANLLAALDLKVQILDEEDAGATLAVVNAESPAGIRYLAASAGAPLKIVIADQEGQGQGQLFLPRPIRVQGLKDAIYDLWNSRLGGAGSTDGIGATPADGPGNLFAALLMARRGGQLVEFSDDQGRRVVLDGGHGLYYSDLEDKALETLAQRPGSLRSLPGMGGSARPQGKDGHPFANLVWMAAWFGGSTVSGGPDTAERRVRLRSFPRLPKLFLRPEYLRVAAMMTKAPLSPRQLALASGVALERVIDLCHIAEVLGILETQAGATPVPAASPRAGRGGLLAKLARRLSSGIGVRG
jgi:hypothetical protein